MPKSKQPNGGRLVCQKSARKRWAKPGERKRWSKVMKLAASTPESKEARSKGQIKRWATPKERKKLIRGIKAAWDSPRRQRQSISSKKNFYKYQIKIQKHLESSGWTVLSKGWPDFICAKGKKVRVIEAKSPRGKLSHEQKKMHPLLQMLGIKVEVLR